MVTLFAFVLTHLVQERNKAQDSKSEYSNYTECNGPGLSVVNAFYEKHETNDGNQDGCGKKWKLHRRPFYQI